MLCPKCKAQGFERELAPKFAIPVSMTNALPRFGDVHDEVGQLLRRTIIVDDWYCFFGHGNVDIPS